MSNSSLGFINPDLLANCTVETCPILTSFYNYRIDLAPNAAFLALFSLAVPWFAGVWLYTKRGYWFMTAMLFGLAAEIIGYSGRILSYNNQWDQNGFLIMTVCLTLGPAFFSAAIYLCLARIVTVYGAENSRLAPSMYTKIFIPCDIVAMILQASGGGIASVALSNNQSLSTSDDIITAGLSSQVFTLFMFMALCIDFGLRVYRRRRQLGDEAALSQEPHLVAVRSSKWFLGFLFALGLATVLVFWRCCYRVAELNQGFVGPVTFKQNLFVGFEGVLMVLAVALLAIFHPALCMGKAMSRAKKNTLTEDGGLNRSEGIKLLRSLRHSPRVKPDSVRKSAATNQIESNSLDGALKESNT